MKKSLLNDAVWLTISKGIVTLFTIISTMLLSRFRTLTDYGTYSELLIIINLVSTALFLGLPNSINFFLPRCEDKTEKRSFLGTYFSTACTMGGIAGALVFSTIPLWVKYFGNSEIHKYWFFLLTIPLTKILTTGADNLFINFHRTNFLVIYRLTHSFIQLVLIFAIQFLGKSFQLYLALYVMIEGAFSLLVVLLMYHEVGTFSFCIKWNLLKRVLIFSIPLGLASAVGMLNVEMDKLIIGYFLTTDELAIYSNASKELPIAVLASSFTTVLIPRISKMIKDEKYIDAAVLWNRVTLFSYSVIVFFCVFLCSFSKEVLVILYSEKYLGGYIVFGIYSISLIFQSTYFGMFLNVTGNTKYIFKASLISMLANAVLNIVFYYLFGFWGPALSTLGCVTLLACYQLCLTSRIINIRIRDIFTLKEYMYPVAILLALAGVTFCLKGFLQGKILSFWETTACGVIWLIIYGVFMLKRTRNLLILMRENTE